MRLRVVFAGLAVLALAACDKPQPLTDAAKTALADSVGGVATQMVAGFAEHLTADGYLGYGERESWVHAEYGTIYPTYDSLAKVLRASIHPGMALHIALSDKHFQVLSRDVVVLTAKLDGDLRDSAGVQTPVHEAWTAVYLRTAAGWKITADHESAGPAAPLPQAATPAPRKR